MQQLFNMSDADLLAVFQSGAISLNEYRCARGLPEAENGNRLLADAGRNICAPSPYKKPDQAEAVES